MAFVRNLVVAGAAALGSVIAAGPVWAQSVQLLGDYSSWSAYSTEEGTGKMCFILSKPTEVSPQPADYTQAYLYLTHRPADGVHNEFNFIAGYALAPETKATVTIGSNTYDLFVEDDAAWLDDASQSDTVAGQMRAGSSMSIQTTTSDGQAVTQTFSLSGVTAASHAIDQACS